MSELVHPMDWAAAMSSEIFREYAKTELRKEANKPIEDAENFEKELDNRLAYHKKIDEFQKQVDASPKLKEYIKKCKFELQNTETRKNANKDFVNGINMIILDEHIEHDFDITASSEKKMLLNAFGSYEDNIDKSTQRLVMSMVDEIRALQKAANNINEPLSSDELHEIISIVAEELSPHINKSIYESKMILSELI